MPQSLLVLPVDRPVKRQRGSGLIGDRLSIPKIIVANGKSFTNANVRKCGGHGAAIDRLLSLATKSEKFRRPVFSTRLMICKGSHSC